MCNTVALGTPSLLQNLPRQQSNQDQDDDGGQDAEELSSLGADDSGAGSSGQAAGSETSAVDGGDVSQADSATSSHKVILRLLEDGETVSLVVSALFSCWRLSSLVMVFASGLFRLASNLWVTGDKILGKLSTVDCPTRPTCNYMDYGGGDH